MSKPRSSPPITAAHLSRSEVTGLIDLQSKLLGEAIERLQREMGLQNESLNTRLGEAIRSLEFAHNEVEGLKSREAESRRINEELRTQVVALKTENTSLRSELAKMTERPDYQDDQGRRNNLRFTGIPESRGETWEQCQQKLSNLLKQHLNASPVIERAHRVGKSFQDRPRDIVAKFNSYADREAIFKNKSKFKNAPVKMFVHEDFCPGTIKARKDQLEQLKQARNEGKNAFFSYRKLVVTDRPNPPVQHPSVLPMPSPTVPSQSLRLPTPLQSRASPVSDLPSPLLQQGTSPVRNAPPAARLTYGDVARTPKGAKGHNKSRQGFAPSSPVSQRLRNK